MKRIICFLILVSALFVSCQYSNNTQQRILTDNTLRIEQFVDTFLVQHPDWDNNSIVREKANKDFKKLFLSTMETENLLEGVPMNLKSVHRNKKKNMVHFYLHLTPPSFKYKQLKNDELGIKELYGDVIGAVSDSVASILKENCFYEVYGRFIGGGLNISTMQNLIGYDELASTDNICIKNELWSHGQTVCVGISYFDIDSVKEFSGRKSYPIEQQPINSDK